VRVLYFSDNGSGHNRRFLEKLSSSGLEVWFLDCSRKQPPDGWLPSGVRLWEPEHTVSSGLAPNEYRGFLPEFQRCVNQIEPDLVHAGPVQSSAFVGALSGFHPLVVVSWGSDILLHAKRDSAWKEATAIALHGADGFFCDCDAVRKEAKEFSSIPDSSIAQFPWGVRSGLFSPSGPLPSDKRITIDPETVPIISTRSWEHLYGITTLMMAFQIAYSRDPRLRLFLLNHGPEAGYVKNFIADHQLGNAVFTPGTIASEELPAWYRAAKGYVSCTESDGTSVSLLEAMATGLPVVVSNLPANREWVKEGENGWLARAGSPEEFASKFLCLAGLEENERKAIAARNQKIVAERADWDKNFPRLLTLYDHVVSRAGNFKPRKRVG